MTLFLGLHACLSAKQISANFCFFTTHTSYLTQYLLEMASLPSDAKVYLVCQHHPGYWNAVSADQFVKQNAIKIGKGGLKDMTLAAELVSECIGCFPYHCSCVRSTQWDVLL